jgi:hypothetical protein
MLPTVLYAIATEVSVEVINTPSSAVQEVTVSLPVHCKLLYVCAISTTQDVAGSIPAQCKHLCA